MIAAISLFGCFGDVPHDNPFDPISDDFDTSGRVSGVVSNRALEPLQDAEVHLLLRGQQTDYSIQTVTDALGHFQFEDLSEGAYRYTVDKEGYASLNDTIEVSATEPANVNLTLNGVPAFAKASVVTAHINRVWPPPTDFTLLEISAELSDVDGIPDLDRVWLEIPALLVSDTLRVTETPGVFALDMDETSLALSSLHELIGKSITIFAQDRLGDRTSSEPLLVSRIITQTPVVNTPQAGAVLSDPRPLLSWVCQSIPFSMSYRIDIVRVDDVVRNTVFVQEDLSPDLVCSEGQEGTLQVDMPLSIGSYFWTVSIVDEFGNRSRSKEAGFVVN